MKKTILYVHHAGGLGGAPKSLAFLINNLDRTLYEPIILTKNGPVVELFKQTGAKVFVERGYFPFHGTTVSGITPRLMVDNFLGVLPTYFKARKIIREVNPDIIHLNTTCLFVFAKAAKDISKKIVCVTHVREPLLDSFAGKILKRYNHMYCDAYIAIDKYDLSKMNTEGKIAEVVYNFVDFSKYNSDVKFDGFRKELGLDDKPFLALYLARIAPSNGTIEMIREFKSIIKEFKDIHLAVVGYNQDTKSEYEISVAREIRNFPKIHLVKFRNDVEQIISSSDIMLCPFTEPHFSRALIEAASIGKPSVAARVGGVEELVVNGQTGFLYNNTEMGSMKECILKFYYNRQLLKTMGKNAERFARKNFDAERNAKKIYDLYERLFSTS